MIRRGGAKRPFDAMRAAAFRMGLVVDAQYVGWIAAFSAPPGILCVVRFKRRIGLGTHIAHCRLEEGILAQAAERVEKSPVTSAKPRIRGLSRVSPRRALWQRSPPDCRRPGDQCMVVRNTLLAHACGEKFEWRGVREWA